MSKRDYRDFPEDRGEYQRRRYDGYDEPRRDRYDEPRRDRYASDYSRKDSPRQRDDADDYTPRYSAYEEAQRQSQPDERQARPEPSLPPMAKTRICRHWEAGTCRMGPRCMFAHGSDELKPKNERDLFKQDFLRKTRICRHWSMGQCPFGDTCQFAHGSAEMRVRPEAAAGLTPGLAATGGGDQEDGELETAAPSAAACQQLSCLCLKPFSRCIFLPDPGATAAAAAATEADAAAGDTPPEHAVRLSTPAGDRAEHNRTLLGGAGQLCCAFYHANLWEAEVKVCLRWPANEEGDRPAHWLQMSDAQREGTRTCGKTQAVVVARLSRGGEQLYTARYANCFRGASEVNVHAERFVFEDAQLLTVIASVAAEQDARKEGGGSGEGGGGEGGGGEGGGEGGEGGEGGRYMHATEQALSSAGSGHEKALPPRSQ